MNPYHTQSSYSPLRSLCVAALALSGVAAAQGANDDLLVRFFGANATGNPAGALLLPLDASGVTPAAVNAGEEPAGLELLPAGVAASTQLATPIAAVASAPSPWQQLPIGYRGSQGPSFTLSQTSGVAGTLVTITAQGGMDFGNDPLDLCVVGVPAGPSPNGGPIGALVPFDAVGAAGLTATIDIPCVPDPYIGVPLKLMVATGNGDTLDTDFWTHPLATLTSPSWVWAETDNTVAAAADELFTIAAAPAPAAGGIPCVCDPDLSIVGSIVGGKWKVDLGTTNLPNGSTIEIRPRFWATGSDGSCTGVKRDGKIECLVLDDPDATYTPSVVASILAPLVEDLIEAGNGSPAFVILDCAATGVSCVECEYLFPLDACDMTSGNFIIDIWFP
ncbi:MAG: hypothetical protein AAF682_28745 [Planctomycetota bacterium]